MVGTERSLSGTHLLCAVGRYQEACSQVGEFILIQSTVFIILKLFYVNLFVICFTMICLWSSFCQSVNLNINLGFPEHELIFLFYNKFPRFVCIVILYTILFFICDVIILVAISIEVTLTCMEDYCNHAFKTRATKCSIRRFLREKLGFILHIFRSWIKIWICF